jgi:hypothetical protein
MITTNERLRRARPSACSDCGWGKIINENNRYACVNPHCSGSSRDIRKKALVYDLLFRVASETMLTIAADPKHLGARIGITLHSWGSAMTHHPHVHMIVPGGGISRDGTRWISSRPAFLLPVRVPGKLFRRLFLTRLLQLHDVGRLGFFGSIKRLAERRVFLRHLSPVRKKR